MLGRDAAPGIQRIEDAYTNQLTGHGRVWHEGAEAAASAARAAGIS